jgi:hypothetical protein
MDVERLLAKFNFPILHVCHITFDLFCCFFHFESQYQLAHSLTHSLPELPNNIWIFLSRITSETVCFSCLL